jgi:hypothetical protein
MNAGASTSGDVNSIVYRERNLSSAQSIGNSLSQEIEVASSEISFANLHHVDAFDYDLLDELN